MPYVDVSTSVFVDLDEIDTDELTAELRRRETVPGSRPENYPRELLEAVYYEFRKRGDAPQCLRDYIDVVMGHVL
jgi:hypothetical protein